MVNPSKIFTGYRAIGFVSNHIALSLRYILKRKENLIVTCVGKSFHTYGSDKLTLLSVSNPHPDDINCITSDSYLTFTACKNIIYAWRRGTELRHVYNGHQETVHLMLPFGPHLISVDQNSTLIVWNIKSTEVILELTFSNSIFSITALVHPSTYLNKILLGSKQGKLQLWNLKTNKLVYEFDGWGHSVTVLEQAPAIDVIAIGLSSGDIYIHNLKYDETIMKFYQDWGSVLAISFRTDKIPHMASASPIGHIAVWDLEKKCLHSEIRNAHRSQVAGMKFLSNEPLMVTNSPDNTLKMWVFDTPDDAGRLLRLREGHSEQPLKIRFHGTLGRDILSSSLDSTLRSFSTAVDTQNKNLGQASFNRKAAKRKGIIHDTAKMPPITDFASETTREKEWSNIVACHRDLGIVTTWSYDRGCMGEHKLLHEKFKGSKTINALCATLTACGNYAFVGYNVGYISKFNVQSGLRQEMFRKEKAHDGCIRAIVCDGLNQVVISGGSDKLLKFWKFKYGEFLSDIQFSCGISQLINHKESSMIAVALDHFSVVIVDQEMRRVVRKFDDHSQRITDMTFSADSRWLIVASMDSTIKTWDLPTGHLLDCFLVSPVCVSLTMSPTSDYLATAHAGDLGIYLWSNKTLYSRVLLHSLPRDYTPRLLTLPHSAMGGQTVESNDTEVSEEEEDIPEFKSPEQIADELVTLSLLPDSHWKNLLNLDVIKARNKPTEPIKQKNIPFFLPVKQGLQPTFLLGETPDDEQEKKQHIIQPLKQLSPFAQLLMECDQLNNFDRVIEDLKNMTPSKKDVEMCYLSPENGGSIELMLAFMKAMDYGLRTCRNYELIESTLGFFYQMHGDIISSHEELTAYLQKHQEAKALCSAFHTKVQRCLCLVRYLQSVHS